MIEEKDYEVTLTITVSTTVRFAPIERDRPITKLDAIDNAIGSIPVEVFEALTGEGFLVATPLDGQATEVDEGE